MPKKKNRKILQLPQSLDARIRTRARNLKIGKCYITEGWDLMREGNIIVTRLHTNGNLTVGFFLVDLGLLGVKDAFYDFNVSEKRLSDILEHNEDGMFIEIEYEIVHNIIYGAVEYAEDYGFYPCKEYAVAKFILEDDNDNIPYIEIEFGAEGFPTVFCDNENPRVGIIRQLEKTVGLGNFKVINTDELDDDSFIDEDHIDYDSYGELMPGWYDDIDELGVPNWDDMEWFEYFKQDPDQLSIRVIQYFADMAFFELLDEQEVDVFKHVLGGAKYKDSYDGVFSDETPEILDIISEIMETDSPGDLIVDAKNRYPHSLSVKFMWIAYITDVYEKEEVRQVFEETKKQYPGNLILLSMYSGWLIANDEADKVPDIFNNAFSLKKFNPGKVFTTNEVIDFCSSYCNYFLAIDDLPGAEPYYEVLDTLVDDDPVIFQILQQVIMAKMNHLQELNQ